MLHMATTCANFRATCWRHETCWQSVAGKRRMSVEMTKQSSPASQILVTGAAGAVGSIGRNVTEMLLAKGHKVRALVRREDERAEALRQLGAEVTQGHLADLPAMHRAIEGCSRVYFGMSVSADYLTATVNTAAVARHHSVDAFVNMSQMTVTQMSITESTDSPQHKLHWLAEQALSWSDLPVVTMRPTVFLDGFFLLGSGPEPCRDLLDQPRVAIRIGEARERPVAGALGVRARLPCFDRERRAVPDVTHLDATADELVIGGLDVGDDQLPLGRAWRGRRESLAERDRGPRARGCELDDAKALHRGDVAVEAPTQALIELLGSVDVGHGNDHDLELHVAPPDARVAACVVYVGV